MLEKFFSPQSVAIVGASREQGKVGHEIIKNLLLGGFSGRIYPVNPKATSILGKKVYARIADIPDGAADLAVIVIPSQYVKESLTQCAQKGTKSVIIISAGFKESGKEGAQKERDLLQAASEYGVRILGPNCLGLINTSANLNASFSGEMPAKGNIAFFSQSGALGTAILDWAVGQRIGFSKFISLGNKADIAESDIMEALCHDPDTKVILGYLEGIERGQEFIHKAREVSKIKPVIITKSGSTSAGTRAASSHTGSLTGSDVAFEAAFKQSGVIRARTIEELFNYALAFAYQPLPQGPNLAIITNAGGPGILAADAAEKNNINLSFLTKETTDKLIPLLPPAASVYNPIDILGDARADRYQKTLEIVLEDPRVHGILIILTPQAMTEIPQTAEIIGEISMTTEKPILTTFMGEYAVKEGIERLARYKIPNYSYPEHAIESFQTMWRYRRWQEQPSLTYVSFEADKAKVRQILDQVQNAGHLEIGDLKAREILAAYQFEVPSSRVAEDSDMAVALADEIGYPVVMKIVSPEILHKSDVGGVRVGLKSQEEVHAAFLEIMSKVRKFMPQALIQGVSIQKMYEGNREVILGMARDPQFGPLIMFGLGGIYVEVLKDVSFRIAPICREEAQAMITEIKSYPMLKGVRGQKPVDIAAIVDALLHLSQLAVDFPEILEADVNPLIMKESGQGAVAVDARFTISPN
jgi:acetyl coenzyme A synthetase (ADP forming)-like protein